MPFVQFVAGTGSTLTLNSVAPHALLTMQDSIYRSTRTGVAEPVPTDTVGTWEAALNPAPAAFIGVSHEVGIGVFLQKDAGAGTHTITPEANTIHHTTFSEWSGADTQSPLDQSSSGGTSNTAHTSRAAGTTSGLASTDEIVLTCHAMAAEFGAADVGYTDPVASYTTFVGYPVKDDSGDLASFHAWKIVTDASAVSATYNWAASEANMTSFAGLVTFKAPPPTARRMFAPRPRRKGNSINGWVNAKAWW